jgi:peptidyl-prolyl cis-trans isomerase B (cyclophilin B)
MSVYQLSELKKGDLTATLKTSLGEMVIRLFPEEAPRTVENFVTHAKNGYYDNLKFHRVINDFMIQGGDPKGNGTGGQSIWGSPFKDEFSTRLYNLRGALSMANAGPNTNGSQFFIVQKKSMSSREIQYLQALKYPDEIVEAYETLGGTMWLDNKHTVFGQLVEGFEVLDAIADVDVDDNDRPLEDVVILGIEIKEAE